MSGSIPGSLSAPARPGHRVSHAVAARILADRDPVIANRGLVDNMEPLVPGLRGKVIVEGAGHWTQQERPEQVNEALLGFIRELD